MIVKGSLEKAKLYIESHSKDSGHINKRLNQGPCITISRETGAGADLVSGALVKFFQPYSDENSPPWTVFDRNLIEKVLEDHHLPHKLSQYFVEDKLSEFKSTVNELLGIHPHAWVLINKTTSTILQLAQIGNCVIVGRAGNVITARLKNCFHVRLVAPIDYRIPHVMEIYNLDRKEAIEFIRKEDAARRNYFNKYFNKNIDDPLLYHIIVNTGNIGYKKAAQIIGRAVIENFSNMFSFSEESLLNDCM